MKMCVFAVRTLRPKQSFKPAGRVLDPGPHASLFSLSAASFSFNAVNYAQPRTPRP